MRVLCKIAGELRVYSVDMAYNMDNINDTSGTIENNLVFECSDEDRTSLLVKMTKDDGDNYIKKLCRDGFVEISEREAVIVESNLLGSFNNVKEDIDIKWEDSESEELEDLV